MVVSAISCSHRTYKYSYVTRGPLPVGFIALGFRVSGFRLEE